MSEEYWTTIIKDLSDDDLSLIVGLIADRLVIPNWYTKKHLTEIIEEFRPDDFVGFNEYVHNTLWSQTEIPEVLTEIYGNYCDDEADKD